MVIRGARRRQGIAVAAELCLITRFIAARVSKRRVTLPFDRDGIRKRE
jgi:hypothetical protein